MVDPSILGVTWRRQLWHRWKSLRKVPFRKSWFIGYDLEGNSYWELIDHNNPTRLRRKVSLDKPYFHFSDFKPHPMWMQWLQFTRRTPPSLVDLVSDAKRQHRLKLLAQQAEEKWRSVPLKSPGSVNGQDPRIDSAWSGSIAPKTEPYDTPEPDRSTRSPPTGSSNESPDTKIKLAMEKAQQLSVEKDIKVTRDNLGQVKVERKKSKNSAEN